MTDKDLNSFDNVSLVYDALARVVYGGSIRDAQLFYLDQLREAKNILIIGGGTGWILQSLLKVNRNASISYVEASAKMLKMARSRKLPNGGSIKFLHSTEKSLPDYPVFDAVIANFYFDLFSDEQLKHALAKIRRSLIPGAILLAADFNPPDRWWQRLLEKCMYRFFRYVSRLRTNRLPQWQFFLAEGGFRLIKMRTFYRGFIRSAVYDFVPFS